MESLLATEKDSEKEASGPFPQHLSPSVAQPFTSPQSCSHCVCSLLKPLLTLIFSSNRKCPSIQISQLKESFIETTLVAVCFQTGEKQNKILSPFSVFAELY